MGRNLIRRLTAFSEWSRPVKAFVGLLLLLFIPLLLLRKLLGAAVSLDEAKIREDFQQRIQLEMQSFLGDATPEDQIKSAFNEVLERFPVASGTIIDETWLKGFLPALKREIPFEPLDLWIFGPDLKNLHIEGTPLHMREKVRWIFAALHRGLYSVSRTDENFRKTIAANQGLNEYQSRQFVEAINEGGQLSERAKSFATELWSERENLNKMMQDVDAGHGDRLRCGLMWPILTAAGRTILLVAILRDKATGRPRGGVVLTIPENRIMPAWYFSRARQDRRDQAIRRRWAKSSPRRPERVWLPNYAGLAWVDVARHHPEVHLITFVPPSLLSVPIKRYLPWVDFLLAFFFLASLLLIWRGQSFENIVSLRIYGQLNVALAVSALLPLIGFVLVAWAYASFHYSFGRDQLQKQLEWRLNTIDQRYRSFTEKQLAKYRQIREWVARHAAEPELVRDRLDTLTMDREIQGFFIITAGGKLIRNDTKEDRLLQSIFKGIAFKLFKSLRLETAGAKSVADLAEAAMGDDLFKLLMAQSLAEFMVSLDRFFLLSTGDREPMVFYIDILYRDREKKQPAGVIVLMQSVYNNLPRFIKQDLLQDTDTRRSIGLDTLKVVRKEGQTLKVFPEGTILSTLERDVHNLAVDVKGAVVRDYLDSSDPWIIGARRISTYHYVVVAGLDGRPLLRSNHLIIWGLSLLVGYALLVLSGVTRFLSGRFAAPLLELRSAAEAVGHRDYSVRVAMDSRDEFGELGEAFNRMAQGLYEREQMSRFVSGDVLEAVKKENVTEHAERAEVTILFSDIRGFTSLSERFEPEVIVTMLNDYFTVMESCIVEQGGIIDKYVGDAIMAVFRDRAGQPPHWWRAARSALDMREALFRFNHDRQMQGLFTVANGIGINTGEVISGRVGSRIGRLDFTVIGDAVNLAARLESESKRAMRSHILISPATRDRLGAHAGTAFLDEVTVKGKEKPVALYELLNLQAFTEKRT